MIQVVKMAIFPQFSIDFLQISLQSTTLSKETKGQGIVQENFTPGQGIIFGNLTPGQGSFLDFPAARPVCSLGKYPSPRGKMYRGFFRFWDGCGMTEMHDQVVESDGWNRNERLL